MGRKRSKKYYKYKKKYGKKKSYYNKPNTSKLETAFELKILDPLCQKYGLEYKKQFKLKTKFYDFAIPKLNLLIEVNGSYWHGRKKDKHGRLNEIQKKNIKNDKYKKKLAIKNKKKLVYFWEDDINNNPLIIRKKLQKIFDR